MAYSLGYRQDVELVLNALDQLKEKKFVKGAILHSDQGVQFTNSRYQMRVKKMELTPSMSRKGNCWDNACIENFFSHLKVEMKCFFENIQTPFEVINAATQYIHYFNHNRINTKLQTSPIKFMESYAS